MPVRPWAAATAAAALLAVPTATAAATDTTDIDPLPTPTPTPTPDILPDLPDVAGSVIYVVTVTTTITTTTVTAPITVIAAPITTTVNNNSNSSATTNSSTNASAPTAQPSPSPAPQVERHDGRMEINLRGCRRTATGHRFARMQTQVRLPRGTQLVVRVNGRQVGTLDLGGAGGSKAVPLRIKVRPDGMLSIWRPSGRVLSTQGCSAR
jgi:hypothetical protein